MPSNYLTPDVPFTDGDDYTPELAYLAFYAPVFDGQTQYLGHREKLRDNELSDDLTALKPRFNTVETSLKVSVVSGQTLGYAAGVVMLPNGSLLTKAASQVVAPDNTTSWVYVTDVGDILCTTNPPVVRCLLARATVVAGTVTELVDLRRVDMKKIMPIASAIKYFGGGSDTDKTCVNGEVFDQGIYYFKTLTVPAGVTVTVDKAAKILCSGNFICQGTINVLPMGFAPSFRTYVNPSSFTLTNGDSATGLGSRGGAYPWGAQTYGTGGSQGRSVSMAANSNGQFGAPGDGGGMLWVEAAGTVSVTGSIFANGGNGIAGNTGNGFNPGVNDPNHFAHITGTGGGSGGLVYLSSLVSVTVTETATVSCRGGNGSSATANYGTPALSYGALGGTGGGGGYIVCCAPSVNTTGANLLLTGGSRGSDIQVNSAFTYAGSTINLNRTNNTSQGGVGGAYGGNSGSYTYATNGNSITILQAQVGKLIIRNFVPLG